MCGICGWLSWNAPPVPSVISAMTDEMRHRGPDARGLYVLGPVALGHRRLAVVDLDAAANQPMTDVDGCCVIVLNGEIYNYRDLRAELGAQGAVFRTRSDTEVILEAYKRWGIACLDRLIGMFAFALWDICQRRLILARDRMGEKPLYYFSDAGIGLVFASELRALLLHPSIDRRIDPKGLGQYLSLNYTLSDSCLIAGVRKLPPAHYMIVDRGGTATPRPYWDLAAKFRHKARYRSENEAEEKLRGLLADAVKHQMVADVPVGAFLSGGIDSATVVSTMARIATPSLVRTFSVGFPEKTYSEVEAARETASFLGVAHHDRTVDLEMASELPRIARFADEPMADSSVVPMYYLAAFAREQVTVCLSGDGGDELFAGYETYRADRLHRILRLLPRAVFAAVARGVDAFWPASHAKVSFDFRLRRFLRGQTLPFEQAHFSWREIFDQAGLCRLLRADARKQVFAQNPVASYWADAESLDGCHYLDRAMYADMRSWLANDILHKVDRATMAHSLEARAPFLDHRLVEFAASLPIEWKIKGLRTKHILRRSQRRLIPPAVIARRKQGFNAPISSWLGQRFGDLARAAMARSEMQSWFERSEVERLWNEHLHGRADHGLKLFGLSCLAIWWENLPPPAGGADIRSVGDAVRQGGGSRA